MGAKALKNQVGFSPRPSVLTRTPRFLRFCHGPQEPSEALETVIGLTYGIWIIDQDPGSEYNGLCRAIRDRFGEGQGPGSE
jgi:hypothetical protein